MDNIPTIEQSNQKQEQIVKKEQIQQPKEEIKKKVMIAGIPEHISNNALLNEAVKILPPHYNFEIYKTLHRIETLAKELGKSSLRLSLQFPQGLMLFACIISDILTEFAFVPIEIIIMGDVTYGACCIDDLASDQMNCDLLVHYGHSCLVPITETRRKVLYVFVEIQIDINHFVDTVVYNFEELKDQTIYILGTIQFNNSLFLAKKSLLEKNFTDIVIPQQKPRSAGEVLGCTSPKLEVKKQVRNIVIFLCDGRFHMEATMIANPQFQFYQYSPYSRELTEQKYAYNTMVDRRKQQLERALKGSRKRVCFILGSLGRQGNSGILDRVTKKIEGIFDYMVLIASEVNVQLLTAIEVDFFVQIACPRLSIDWSYGTPKPLLTPYELYAMVDKYDFSKGYSMDYYSHNGGPWSNFYGKGHQKKNKIAKAQPKIKLSMEESSNCCQRGQCDCGKK